jgi:uncharacterized protein (DUF2141 family)
LREYEIVPMRLLPLALALLPLATLALPAPAGAVMVGDVAACEAGRPAIKVRVTGFKQQKGQLRFALYGAGGWLKKGGSLKKLRVPVTAPAMDVCVAVPQPGSYAVAIHHDLDADKERDRSDGAGFSRNPRLSLLGKPSFASSSVQVGEGVRPLGVQLMYLRGLTIGPARGG